MAMAMLSALAAENVAALGLGEIELRSALNQPLLAEVELVSATPAELNELKVAIASSQAFEDAGIERPLFLTKFQFKVEKNTSGSPVVKITSRDSVREPFLDFLLELSWSKGKLLREYTVLVDPPVTMPAPVPVPRVPVAQYRAPMVAPATAPVSSARRVQHTAQMPPVSVAPGEYLTRRNDTLWKVAGAVRPDTDVSMEQAMLGLLRTNPEAFYEGNINNLKAGYVLRVPSRDEMTSLSQAQARQEARAQYQAWRQARQGAPVAGEQPVASTQVVPAVTTGSAAPAQLQLVSPELSESGAGAGTAEGASDLGVMKRDLMMANEALEAQRRQGEEMSGRLSVLEEQILNMQRLVQLKDDQLAQLQAQVAERGEDVAEVAGAVDAEDMPAGAAEPAEVVGEVAGAAEPAGEEAGADGVAEVEAIEVLPAETVAEVVAEAPVFAPVQPDAAPSQPEAVAEPVAPETNTTPGLVEQILANPLWLGAGGVLLALLAFFGLRRKGAAESGFEESILQASRGAEDSDSEIVSARRATESKETSLLSEFAVSDMGSLQQGGEADPLAEADVYLAYGRFQQAEDLVGEALENNPDDESLNLKLLEVFLAAKNPAGFDEHAQALRGRLTDGGGSFWEKVSEMGRELSPENPIYQAGTAVADDIDSYEDTDLADGLGDYETTDADAEEMPGATRKDDEGLDFDLDLSYSADALKDENKPDSVEFTPPEESSELEFDMGSIEPEAIEQDSSLDFDLEGMDLGGEEELEGGTGDGELTDLDEVSTKLDLARAYIDMGDPDGARSILDEVLEEGSDDQINEAKGIMEQIS